MKGEAHGLSFFCLLESGLFRSKQAVHGPAAQVGSSGRSALTVYGRHHGFGVAGSGGDVGRGDFVECTQLLRSEADIGCCGVFFQILDAFGAGYGHDVLGLLQGPGESELRGRDAFGPGNRLKFFNQLQVFFEVFSLEAGIVAAPVIGLQIVFGLDLAGEEAAAER
jgi:hypothetical protein